MQNVKTIVLDWPVSLLTKWFVWFYQIFHRRRESSTTSGDSHLQLSRWRLLLVVCLLWSGSVDVCLTFFFLSSTRKKIVDQNTSCEKLQLVHVLDLSEAWERKENSDHPKDVICPRKDTRCFVLLQVRCYLILLYSEMPTTNIFTHLHPGIQSAAGYWCHSAQTYRVYCTLAV